MDDIQIRLTTLEIKVDKILKKLEGTEKSSSNPYNFMFDRPPVPKTPAPSKKRPKKGRKKFTKKRDKGGEKYSWSVGDCVRPKGMPSYYIIKEDHNEDNWLMIAPSGGGHEITDIIPKNVENSGAWEKVKCETGKKKKPKKTKKKSKKKLNN
tara:strand:- start:458 stop:913 length:456 start_codon:yes stop_codon:yes gene_type:complete